MGADPKTVITYFSILEDTLVGFLLPAFHRSVRKQQRSNPKFHFFDTGVKRALDRTLDLPLNAGTYEYGKAFEHFVLTQIVHLSQYRYPDWKVSYLRTGAGVEIDLVIERPGLPTALIEIKSAERVDERDVRHLTRFTGDFPEPLALCISRDPSACGSAASSACTGARLSRNWGYAEVGDSPPGTAAVRCRVTPSANPTCGRAEPESRKSPTPAPA